jgi:hypothetical protein
MNHQGAGTVFFPGRGLSLFFTLAIAISTTAAPTPGVTDNSMLIGSGSALDGPPRFLGNQTVLGCDNLSAFHQRRRRGFWP